LQKKADAPLTVDLLPDSRDLFATSYCSMISIGDFQQILMLLDKTFHQKSSSFMNLLIFVN
jgi:uncharacterized protein YyaL (SSP411 family)